MASWLRKSAVNESKKLYWFRKITKILHFFLISIQIEFEKHKIKTVIVAIYIGIRITNQK